MLDPDIGHKSKFIQDPEVDRWRRIGLRIQPICIPGPDPVIDRTEEIHVGTILRAPFRIGPGFGCYSVDQKVSFRGWLAQLEFHRGSKI